MNICKIVLILFFFCLSLGVYFCRADNQTEDKGISLEQKPLTESVKKGFEEAIQKLDAEKEKEQKRLAAELKGQLDAAVEDWINQEKKKRSRQRNTIVEQNWENLTEFGPRFHYSYYLRDYSYTVISTDIFKTTSMIGSCQAVLNVVEKLFAERYHSPDVTYPKDFYYTVTMPIKVNFEYVKDKFIITGIEYGKGSFDHGWRR